ncbi:MAG TPA: isocitrate/isopropylmalate family dehydrogenase [Candidatus Dormibacteraeota bacterium]|nr:isocitrate/isopropylmalate family dehydrogenase [Candidatus Dormibacteraeota bacterium]
MTGPTITVLHGDETGEELLVEALRILTAPQLASRVLLEHVDLSLAARRATENGVVHQAAQMMKVSHFGLKAATVTPEGIGEIESPNAILRVEVGGDVIVRTGRRIPGVAPLGGVHSPITIVRMAVDDAYGAIEWREGEGADELAFRTTKISREHCRRVAEYAFVEAGRTGATVFGGPKFTVSRVYEGMLKEEMDAAGQRHPDVRYEPQLIDATFALLLTRDDRLVIPALNRDGDILADLVLALYGSLAGSESLLIGFDDSSRPSLLMAEAPHGTAPALEGRHIANPMAMILAAAALLEHTGDTFLVKFGGQVRDATMAAVFDGVRTADLGGHARTEEFTVAVLERLPN